MIKNFVLNFTSQNSIFLSATLWILIGFFGFFFLWILYVKFFLNEEFINIAKKMPFQDEIEVQNERS